MLEQGGCWKHWGLGGVLDQTSQVTDKETLEQNKEVPSEAGVT